MTSPEQLTLALAALDEADEAIQAARNALNYVEPPPPPPNDAPVGAFTFEVSNLGVGVNGTTSSDGDGEIVGYEWNFGDGTIASGPTATHTYEAAGSYSVTLTVTDDQGATDSEVQEVTVTEPVVEEPPIPLPATVEFSELSSTASTISGRVTALPRDQVANGYIVGRKGVDQNGYPAWNNPNVGAMTGTFRFDKLLADTDYPLVAQATQDGVPQGDPVEVVFRTQVEPVVEPVEPVEPTPPAGPGKVQVVGRSGLPINMTVFRGGDSTTAPATFENWLGRLVDGMLYFPARQTWNDLRSGLKSSHKTWLDSGRILIYSIPFAPQQYGSAMNGEVLRGEHDASWRAFGAWLAASGFNTSKLVLRLGWEGNGDWYAWSYGRTPGSTVAERAANVRTIFKRIVDNIRAGGADKVLFDQCHNKGPSQSGISFSAFPGRDWCDIIGIDQYDQWRPYSGTAASKENVLSQTPSFRTTAEFAEANGVRWSIDEWGPANPKDADHAGDSALFPPLVMEVVQKHLVSCAWVNIYDHPGAPSTLRHTLSDGSNPNFSSTFRRPWPAGWAR